MTRLTTLNLPDFYKATIGFDRMFDDMQNAFTTNATGGYPPYNIVKESDTSYTISLAVAGFDKEELTIEQDGNTLSISAEKKEADDKVEYLHKGIGTRSFNREFSLADYVEVTSSKLDNGILIVTLEQNIPDEKKPRTINID
jgi:molecular chaperone IbpA